MEKHLIPQQNVDERFSEFYQVVDDVEAVIFAVVGADAAVSLLPHVILQCGFISEGFLAVQTLQTDRTKERLARKVTLQAVGFN